MKAQDLLEVVKKHIEENGNTDVYLFVRNSFTAECLGAHLTDTWTNGFGNLTLEAHEKE